MNYKLINMDFLAWLERQERMINFYGRPDRYFHALLSDWPYNLTSILKRFGKEGSAPAQAGTDGSFTRQSAGFMGQTWDTDFAYRPETWEKIKLVLWPGGITAGFSHNRKEHLLATAQEAAGFLIDYSIGMEWNPISAWTYGSGKPTGTRVDLYTDDPRWQGRGFQYGAPLKPSFEPIRFAFKPFEDNPVDSIVRYGAGAYNIEAGKDFKVGQRFPDTYVPVHHPDCVYLGPRPVKNGSGSVTGDEPSTPHKHVYSKMARRTPHKASKVELVPTYDCHPDCPVKDLQNAGRSRFFFQADWNYEIFEQLLAGHTFYHGKVTPAERNAGLGQLPDRIRQRANSGGWSRQPEWAATIQKNHHPTLKPIKLTKYIASLLLPPPEYYPRIIVVPCCGTGSEIIGCLLAGWDLVVGIENNPEYFPILVPRVEWWREWVAAGQKDIDEILAHANQQAFAPPAPPKQLRIFANA